MKIERNEIIKLAQNANDGNECAINSVEAYFSKPKLMRPNVHNVAAANFLSHRQLCNIRWNIC